MSMIKRFLLFGVIGWCMEIIWTGFASLFKGDLAMTSKTSIWMFFIYGFAGLLQPVINYFMRYPLVVRGGLYVLFIFAVEFICGFLMTQFNACPWDYSGARYNVMGVIRLDFAPVWFLAGVIFEYAHKSLDKVF